MAAKPNFCSPTSPQCAGPSSTCRAPPAPSSAPTERSRSRPSSLAADTLPRRRITRKRPPSSCSRATRADTGSARHACRRPSSSPTRSTGTSPITCTSASRSPSRRRRFGESSASSRSIGWGVIGATSQVAQKAVLPAIVASPGAHLAAVASESAADGGGGRFGAARAYRTYAALLDDPEVDAVYVPLPNGLHRQWVERAAAAGKHVLCEKPLAPTAADAEAMGAACAEAGVALLEAYMTPFHPRA